MMKNWIERIDETTSRFSQTFGHLPVEKMNWKPQPDTWSIGQNLDHLICINSTYFPIFKALQEGTYQAPWMARIGFLVNLSGDMVLKAVQPDRKKKMKTFPIWEPGHSEIAPGILDRFGAHQEELKDGIKKMEALLKQNPVIASPANRNIVYKLETALDIIVSHEARHFEQSVEVLTQMEKALAADKK